jgi:autotransporter-associated beta strand protein
MSVNRKRIGWFGLMMLVATGSASAANYTWNGGLSGVWDTSASNWSSATGTPWAYGNTHTATFGTDGAAVTVSGTVYMGAGNALTVNSNTTLTGSGVITSTNTANYYVVIQPGATLTSDTSFMMPSNGIIYVSSATGTGPATFALTGGFLGCATNTADLTDNRRIIINKNTVVNQSGGLVSTKTFWVGANEVGVPATYNLTGGLLDINSISGGQWATLGYQNGGNNTTGIVTLAGASAKMIVRNGTSGARLSFGWSQSSAGWGFLNLQQGELQANVIAPYSASAGIGFLNLGGTNGTAVLRPYSSDHLALGLNGPNANMFFTLVGTNGVISSTDASGVGRTTTVYLPMNEDQPGRGVTFEGLGTVVLNTNNTYSGTTWIRGGIVQANHAGGLTNTSIEVVESATLKAGGPLKSLAVSVGQVTVEALVNRDVTIGAFARNPNTVTRFIGTLNPTPGNGIKITSGISNDVTGIIGCYAVMNGTNWARVNGSGMLEALPASDYVKSSVTGTIAANYANTNIDVDVSQTVTGNITPNSLRFMVGTASLTLPSTGTNVIQSGGILIANASNNSLTGGSVTSGSADGSFTVFHEGGISWYLNSLLVDNGSSPVTLVKAGAGMLQSNGGYNHTGDTFILGGTLRFPAASQLRGGDYSGRLVIEAGALFDLRSTANQILRGVISGNGNLFKGAASTLTLTGTNSYAGLTTVSGGTLNIDGIGVSPLVVSGGKVTVNGTSTGGASVNAATLEVNGVLNGNVGATNSAVTVGAAGVLNGSLVAGTNCSVTLSNLVSGSVSVLGTNFVMNGSVGGSLTIASNAMMSADGQVAGNTIMSGAKYTATIKDALGDCTRLTTLGTLNLTGATLTLSDPGANLVTRGPAGYVLMKYGSRIGEFASVTSDSNTKVTYDDAAGEIRIQYQPRGTMIRIF